MKSRNDQSNPAPLIASALLAVGPVGTPRPNRVVRLQESPLAQSQHHVDTKPQAQSIGWYQRVVQAVDQLLIRLFYCAIPSGLEAHDFDLSKLVTDNPVGPGPAAGQDSATLRVQSKPAFLLQQ
ncbi:MAG: hypothetical protein R2867_16410 [Caldilineaceae bacterium]